MNNRPMIIGNSEFDMVQALNRVVGQVRIGRRGLWINGRHLHCISCKIRITPTNLGGYFPKLGVHCDDLGCLSWMVLEAEDIELEMTVYRGVAGL